MEDELPRQPVPQAGLLADLQILDSYQILTNAYIDHSEKTARLQHLHAGFQEHLQAYSKHFSVGHKIYEKAVSALTSARPILYKRVLRETHHVLLHLDVNLPCSAETAVFQDNTPHNRLLAILHKSLRASTPHSTTTSFISYVHQPIAINSLNMDISLKEKLLQLYTSCPRHHNLLTISTMPLNHQKIHVKPNSPLDSKLKDSDNYNPTWTNCLWSKPVLLNSFYEHLGRVAYYNILEDEQTFNAGIRTYSFCD